MFKKREGVRMAEIDGSYRVVQHISETVGLLSAGSCFYLLAKFYVEEKRTAVFAGMTYALTMLAVYFCAFPLGTVLTYTVGVLAAFFSLCILEPKNYEQKLILSITFFSMRGFCAGIAEIVYDNVYQFAENTAFMHAHENLDLLLYIGVCLLFQIVEFSCMAGGISCMVRVGIYRKTDLSKRGYRMLFLIPALTGVTGFVLLGYYRNYYIGETGKNSDQYDLLASLFYGASLAAVLAAVVLYQSIKAKQEERLQNDLLIAQIESMQLHIEHVEGLYRDIRGMKHDMTNHILTLEQLYEENQTKEARAYSADLKEMLAQTAGGICSGNPVTDVILQMHKEKAERMGVSFCPQFYFPEDCRVNAFDMSIILNNALQNALESMTGCAAKVTGQAGLSENGAYLSVASYRKSNAFLIEIENSFAGSLRWNAKGMPCSTKGEGHGYGLANIQKVAKKYDGDIDILCDGTKFCLTIMLMLEG